VNALTRILLAAAAGFAPAIAIPSDAPQAPNAAAQLDQMQDTLRRTHGSGDTTSYLGTAQSMYSFLNGSPRATLQLMSAESVAGRQDDALRSFAQFVAMGQANDEALRAAQFEPLRTLPKFQAIQRDMAANTSSMSHAAEVFRLNPSVPIPEDIDYDPATKRFYISSVLGKHIVAVDMAGQVTAFAQAPDQWPMMALKIDAARRVLWATEAALQGFALAPEKDWGRSAVLLYDLRSGSLLHRIEGPPQAALGDMTLDLNGDAIVSDGEHGGVYRVSRKTQTIERIDAGDFVSPQTPVVLSDGKHILVPDYVRGIGVLNPATKQVAWIPMEGRHDLSGIDGLYAAGNTLIATQNGTSPDRVVRFALDASKTHVISESVIERATATLGDPTHGVMVGGYFYYIANSGWDNLDEHGVLIPGKTLSAPLLMRAKL
jgi:sugar lactone lactonase YvrE